MSLITRTLAPLPDDSFLVVPESRREQFLDGNARAPAVRGSFVFFLDVKLLAIPGAPQRIKGVAGLRYPVTKFGMLDYIELAKEFIAILDNPTAPPTSHKWLPSAIQLRRLFAVLGLSAPSQLAQPARAPRTFIPPGARPQVLPPGQALPRNAMARGT